MECTATALVYTCIQILVHICVCVCVFVYVANLIWCSSFCSDTLDGKEVGNNVMFSSFGRT